MAITLLIARSASGLCTASFQTGIILAIYVLTASKHPIGACFPRQIVDKPSPNDEGSTSLAKREKAYDSASTSNTRTRLQSATA